MIMRIKKMNKHFSLGNRYIKKLSAIKCVPKSCHNGKNFVLWRFIKDGSRREEDLPEDRLPGE